MSLSDVDLAFHIEARSRLGSQSSRVMAGSSPEKNSTGGLSPAVAVGLKVQQGAQNQCCFAPSP